MSTKRCSKCGESKPLSEFYPNRKPSHGRPGLRSTCKGCSNDPKPATRKDVVPKPPLPTAAELRTWHDAGCRLA